MEIAAAPDLQPILVGEALIVRPLRAEDWREMSAAASDPLIWELHPDRERYKETVFREYFDSGMIAKSAFAFVERGSGAIIGSSRYHGYDWERSEIEIGWTFLIRKYWGGATNREVKRLMLGHAFAFVDTAIFWVGERNWRSQRAMEKIGAVRRDGLFTRSPGGVPHVVFQITKANMRL